MGHPKLYTKLHFDIQYYLPCNVIDQESKDIWMKKILHL